MAKKRINREKDFENGTVQFTVIDTGKTLATTLTDLPEDIIRKLALHGLNAKVGDAAADPNVDALDAMTSVYKQLTAGDWNVKGAGGGSKITQAVEALMRISDKDLETVNAQLANMSDDERDDLFGHEQVKAMVKQIKAEKATAAAKKAAKDAKTGEALQF